MTILSDCIYTGDCLSILKDWPDSFVQCVVTSPPYWGLRDYGVKGQAGLEKTPEEYVSKMVEIFRHVRRVLKDDGTLWLNMGDSYAGNWNSRRVEGGGGFTNGKRERNKHPPPGLKIKDLIGIPWRVALALQSEGWYLRSDIIWSKPNPMPESVTDRPTRAHEYIFLMTKSERYFYNAEAIKESNSRGSIKRFGLVNGIGQTRKWNTANNKRDGRTDGTKGMERFRDHIPLGRNKRSVWEIATKPYKEAHFATFPEDLIAPCIKAGSRPGDIVLDPFAGSGTTCQVAKRYGRQWIGIELNPDYVKMANNRISGEPAPLLVE